MDINLVNLNRIFKGLKKEKTSLFWKGNFKNVFFFSDKEEINEMSVSKFTHSKEDFTIDCRKVMKVGNELVILV